jgi:hypothetical protein
VSATTNRYLVRACNLLDPQPTLRANRAFAQSEDQRKSKADACVFGPPNFWFDEETEKTPSQLLRRQSNGMSSDASNRTYLPATWEGEFCLISMGPSIERRPAYARIKEI